MDPRKLKDEASQAVAKGKYKKAAELYLDLARVESDDPLWPHRAGEALRRAGANAEAVVQLSIAAEAYAKQGFLLKAISVAKMILEIDPRHHETQAMLTSLYAKRDSAAPPARLSPSQSNLAPPAIPISKPALAAIPISKPAIPTIPISRPAVPPVPISKPAIPIASIPLASIPLASEPLAAPTQSDESEPLTLDITDIELVPLDEIAAHAGPPELPPSYRRFPTIDKVPLARVIPGARVTANFGIAAFEIPLAAEAPPALPSIADAPPLPRIALFSSLDERRLRALIERSRIVVKFPGDVILRQGEKGDALYVIVHGEVDVTVAGTENPIARLGEGSFFGELALLTEQRRLATVTAATDVELLEIGRDVVWELIEDAPDVLQTLLRFFRDRLLDRLVATSPLFAPFSGGESRELAERFDFLEIKPETEIVTEGKRAEGLFVVLAGACDVISTEAGPLAVLGPGDLAGEMSLLTHSPSVATVRARTRVWALGLSRPRFQELISTHPQILIYVNDVAEARRAATLERLHLV